MRTVAGLACAVVAAAIVPALAQQTPTFRTGVDLLTIDVEVIDRDGTPAADLGPEQFVVTIDGKTRRVISADRVGFGTSSVMAPAEAASPPSTRGVAPPTASRVYVLAFDVMSFRPLEAAPARAAAHAFVERLSPADRVAVIPFPHGPNSDLTTNHEQILSSLDRLVGWKAEQPAGGYPLTPSQIADLTYLYDRELLDAGRPETWGGRTPTSEFRTAVADACASAGHEDCQRRIVSEANSQGQFQEVEIAQRVGGLMSLLRSLGAIPGRKTVILVSAGLPSPDRSGARPAVGDLPRALGLAAAESNATIHALHFDRAMLDTFSAQQRGPSRSNVQRDSAIMARPLDMIAGTSGGGFFSVVQGGGEFAFDRILKETAAHYVLGVEPDSKDKDGRPHEMKVRVERRQVTVRSRSWVVFPKTPPTTLPAASALPAAVPLRPAATPVPPRLRNLTDAYLRGYAAAIDRALAQPAELANMLIDLRGAETMWPDAPRRYQAMALELAVEGLRSPNGFARDAAVTLLTHAHLLVQQAPPDDPFACAWYRTEAAALAGLWQPEFALPYVTRAAGACPGESRLALAQAVILDQRARTTADPARGAEAAAAYAAVPHDTAAGFEAAVRAAWVAHAHGENDKALALLADRQGDPSDTYLQYLYQFVRGEALRARGGLDEAEAAYRLALTHWPGAQSVRVALMTLLIERGEGDAASAAADAIQRSAAASDPWWTFTRGDFRRYPSLRDALRELIR